VDIKEGNLLVYFGVAIITAKASECVRRGILAVVYLVRYI
jgi:hypothetical protein